VSEEKELVQSNMRTRERAQIWLGGEFETAPGISRETAQKQFLLLASELYGVTASLRDNVLPQESPLSNFSR
jgi:hypothetical protein